MLLGGKPSGKSDINSTVTLRLIRDERPNIDNHWPVVTLQINNENDIIECGNAVHPLISKAEIKDVIGLWAGDFPGPLLQFLRVEAKTLDAGRWEFYKTMFLPDRTETSDPKRIHSGEIRNIIQQFLTDRFNKEE